MLTMRPTCRRNPAGIENDYLAALNQCFPGWGGQDRYDWCFKRSLGGRAADLLLLADGKEVLAGSGVSYREIGPASGPVATIGIMTGSWTLPAARGRGCFAQIIEESLAACRDRNARYLLAFVVETNASFRRLTAAGSRLYSTAYLFAPPALHLDPHPEIGDAEIVSDPAAIVDALSGRAQLAPADFFRFHYGSLEEWRGQFVERPQQTYALRFRGGAVVILEINRELARILLLSPCGAMTAEDCIKAAALHAHTIGRRLASTTARPETIEIYRRLGFEAAPGFITLIAADGSPHDTMPPGWLFDDGDRM
jgi:GNAT superfamily N-acetyltransferase